MYPVALAWFRLSRSPAYTLDARTLVFEMRAAYVCFVIDCYYVFVGLRENEDKFDGEFTTAAAVDERMQVDQIAHYV